jgi:hypothetical protein
VISTIRTLFAADMLRQQGAPRMQNDQSDFGGGKPPGSGGVGTNSNSDPNGAPQQPPEVQAAPYIKLLTKLGYEYQGSDEDLDGMKIGSSFQGTDGDMILIKEDGSWMRMGPGAQNSQGKDVPSLGQALVKDSLQQGDDQNHNSALRQAGYKKIHQDTQGNSYYKHPQTGKTVHVTKDGKWGSSVGTGRGAGKLRDFLGNEQLADTDPNMMKMKMQTQQMKMQSKQQQQMKRQGATGTRGAGAMGTRAPGGMGGRGGF